ncbi:hypothetical protein BGW80DRAFT_1263086 [Lactifluus volemus]|nr:hypothetical protein BGW80DRAFT_1263086 [Lactifluus volemus]
MSSPTHLSPTSPSLRKSFSVDSFSRQSRPPPVSSTSRQHKAFPTVTAAEEPPRALPSPWQPQGVDSPQVSCFPRDPSFPLSGRSRGASISTIGDENNQSIPEESDVEVVRDAPQLSTGPRRTGSKIKIKLRPPLPPELLPSSKLHDTIPASPESTAGVNDATPRLPSAMAPTFSYRAPKAGPSSQLSEDITTAGSASGSSTPCTDFGSGLQPVTVVVIGENGCGKSAAISKGLKAYKLAEPVTITNSAEDDALHQYTSRKGKVTDDKGADAVLDVLEIDATILKARLEANLVIWPEKAPPVDGVIVCCDVSRENSFAEMGDILPAFREARLPIVALACKCDLENLLDLKMVHERLTRLDIGLVQVTISNEDGKNRLRLAFDWLLRAISHNRRSLTRFVN